MNFIFEDGFSIKEFIINNRDHFETMLLKEAVNVKDKINEIHRVGNINLVGNAHKVVLYIVEEREEELITFAQQEGIAWAKYALTLSFKLEWVQAIRRTLWEFLYQYDKCANLLERTEDFYKQEKSINVLIDHFFTNFFMAYSKYKDELLEKQRELVINLSVPIIPISKQVSVLPLIGSMDENRLRIIQEKVLIEIDAQSIETLIMDLSGVAPMNSEAVDSLSQTIDAAFMMGCKVIITGLRKEVVLSLRNPNVNFSKQVSFKGTLHSALSSVV